MKPYKQVVAERYDGYERHIHLYQNQYALLNPIGFTADRAIRKAFYKAFNHIRSQGVDLTSCHLLDIGCGKGYATRLFSEFTGNPKQITGIDLSETRVREAQILNPAINYLKGDLVELPTLPQPSDIITVMDVFMHLATEEEINQAFHNIHNQLINKGFFIWYDAYAKDHFTSATNADHRGFNITQSIQLAHKAGFTLTYKSTLFKTFFNRYHSLYFSRYLPNWVISLLEALVPGKPGNFLLVFQKQ
jgi:SAM-dependent methyltransferase